MTMICSGQAGHYGCGGAVSACVGRTAAGSAALQGVGLSPADADCDTLSVVLQVNTAN